MNIRTKKLVKRQGKPPVNIRSCAECGADRGGVIEVGKDEDVFRCHRCHNRRNKSNGSSR